MHSPLEGLPPWLQSCLCRSTEYACFCIPAGVVSTLVLRFCVLAAGIPGRPLTAYSGSLLAKHSAHAVLVACRVLQTCQSGSVCAASNSWRLSGCVTPNLLYRHVHAVHSAYLHSSLPLRLYDYWSGQKDVILLYRWRRGSACNVSCRICGILLPCSRDQPSLQCRGKTTANCSC